MRRIHLGAVAFLIIGCASVPERSGRPIPIPPPSRPVSELLAQLREPDEALRTRAAWALTGVEAPAPEVETALEGLRDDPSENVRLAVTWALAHMTMAKPQEARRPPAPDETPPRMLRQTRPIYPASAFSTRVQGVVLIEILISESGDVVYAEARKSIPELDQAALDCVRQWKFSPAKRGERKVPLVAQAPVTFRMF